MKTRTLLLGAAAALILNAPASAGMPNGWYLSLEGGANWVEDWSVTQISTPDGVNTDIGSVGYDTGWAVLTTVGYNFGRWGAEFETGYRKNELDAFTLTGVPASIDALELDEVSFMANVLYNHPVTERITLSFGAGAGADFAQMEVTSSGTAAEDEHWSFAYQGLARLNYAVGQRSELFLAYRYFRASDPSFDFNPNINARLEGDDFVKHTATLGFRYYLNGPEVPMAEAPPPAPPPATPDSAPTEFIIFFGHNKSNLTAAAMEVVRDAAAAAKQTGSANVKIVGHTDRSGSDSYNQALSMRRANTVKGALVNEGVASGSIAVDARGESDPMVPTADGVREPQNRRVNISF